MSPRQQLAIGDYGTISHTRTAKGWEALTRFRDTDGVTRRVKASGRTKGAAGEALKAKLKLRENHGSGESRVSELAAKYLALKEGEDLAGGTLYHLRGHLTNVIVPRLGGLRVREVSPPVVENLIRAVTTERGPGAALQVRSTLSGLFNAAARWGYVQVNPVSFVPVPKQRPREIRALTALEVVRMRDYAVERLRPRTDAERLLKGREIVAARTGRDVADVTDAEVGVAKNGADPNTLILDIMHVLLATGCRAGEAIGLAWEDVHLDAPEPWVEIRQQAVYVPGEGVLLTQTKEHDIRRLRLRGPVLAMLRERRGTAKGPLVFASRTGKPLNPSNIGRAWNKVFAGSEWDWVTQKTMRKTVATLVSETHDSMLASKQLGHTTDKVTRAHYIAQSIVPIDTGEALQIFGT